MGCGASTGAPASNDAPTVNKRGTVPKPTDLTPEDTEAIRKSTYESDAALLDAVENGDVRLLKGSWFAKEFAASPKRLPRRQDIPDEAFWDPAELRKRGVWYYHGAKSGGKGRVAFISLSYSWATPEHPDPHGVQMQTVAGVIKMRLEVPYGEYSETCHDVALFIDYACLYQKARTAEQDAAFKRGLGSMDIFYGHQKITVLLLTAFAPGSGNDSAAPKYAQRGWPTFENGVSSMIHMGDVFDLARLDGSGPLLEGARDEGVHPGPVKEWRELAWKCGAARMPPLHPTDFSSRLEAKKFTNGADCEVVKALYAKTYKRVQGSNKTLQYMASDYYTGDEAAMAIAQCLPYADKLTFLQLIPGAGKPLAAATFEALASVLEDPDICPKLETICFTMPGNPPSGASPEMKARFKRIFKQRRIRSDSGQI